MSSLAGPGIMLTYNFKDLCRQYEEVSHLPQRKKIHSLKNHMFLKKQNVKMMVTPLFSQGPLESSRGVATCVI